MATLHDVIVYLVDRYPYKDELSNARVTKMVYLADWRAAIQNREQITTVKWEFNHYGPWVPDVIETAKSDPDLEVYTGETMYGSPKKLIRTTSDAAVSHLRLWESAALDHVIEQTKDLNWSQFIELVYSTYPIVSKSRYSDLDLVALAADYADLQKAL